MKVTGLSFTKKDSYGDFLWMIKQPEFSNVLFVFNENYIDSQDDIAYQGAGSAVIRPYTHRFHTLPKAAGIPTGWCIQTGGFDHMNRYVQLAIDYSFQRIERILYDDKSLTEIMFSCDEHNDKIIGSRIFKPSSQVIEYVSKRLASLQSINLEVCKRKHDVLNTNEHILLEHANMHKRIAFLEEELKKAKKESVGAITSNMYKQTKLKLYQGTGKIGK